MKNKERGVSAERKWVTIRVTESEKKRLLLQAEIAGLSLSDYMRRRFFGGRPLVAHTDLIAVAELRRVGGLLKHNFEAMRQAHAPAELFKAQENALRLLVMTIERLSRGSGHDR